MEIPKLTREIPRLSRTRTRAPPADVTISGTATNDNGTVATNSLDVSVTPVPPTLVISGASSVPDDTPYVLNLAASDPNQVTISSWTINWGDGTVQTVSGNPSSVTHTYTGGPNNYTISASATDANGTYDSNTLPLTVTPAPLGPTISGNPTVNEGDVYTLNLSATDPDQDPISSWTINWGDGSPPQTVTGNPSSVTHVFADAGSYTVNAAVTDDQGSYSATPLSVTAELVPPTVTISGASTVNEEATYTLNLSATGEPANHPITSWTINWGDGSTPQTVSGNPSSATYVYANAGTYTITASANEDEGTFAAAAPVNVTVGVVPPMVTISGAATVNEDATYTLNLSATGEPSNHPITSWTINWGDGSAPQTISGNPSSATYVYANAGSYTITASATEDEGTFAASAPVNVTVEVVPPTVTISGPSTVNEDATYTLDLSATGEPSNHPITSWTINWGDGSSPQTVTGNPSSATYVYSNAGTYTITASATEDEGTFPAAPLTVGVRSKPPRSPSAGRPRSMRRPPTRSISRRPASRQTIRSPVGRSTGGTDRRPDRLRQSE